MLSIARRPNKISMIDVRLLGRNRKLRINEGVILCALADHPDIGSL